MMRRSEAFVSTSSPPLSLLRQARIAAALEAWPELSIPIERFEAYVEQRCPITRDAQEHWASCCVEDLLLACACVEGDARATKVLSKYLEQEASTVRRQLGIDADASRELGQRVLESLLVKASASDPARLALYSGHGPLRAWLRAAVFRAGLRRAQADRGRARREQVAKLPVGRHAGDPAALHENAQAMAAFRLAFREAVDSLEPRERTVLRMHFLDGLTLEEVGSIHGVHRATAARWIAQARTKLEEVISSRVLTQLGEEGTRLDSLLGPIRSQLEVSLSRFWSGS